MKFRVSKDDLIIFIIFCILLLYLCAIAVLNFVEFGAHGKLYGLVPFEAFTGKYIGITFTLFIASLIVIFTSVSSYIFSKDGSGIGLKIGEKEEKGYNRWAKLKEMKEADDIEMIDSNAQSTNAAGIPVYADKKGHVWVDNGEFHSLVIGSSGSGKTLCVVKPMVNILAKNNESMIITDPKGEIYQESAEYLKSLGYKVIVLNFREPTHGSAWNPLALPYQFYKAGNKDKAIELLDDVSSSILDVTNKSDPFWEKSASSFFAGCALSLFENAKEEETNLNSINAMTTDGDERFGTSKYINEYFKMMGTKSNAYTFASGTIESPNETQGGILASFREKIRTFTSRDNLSEMLGHSDFDMREIGKGKTAVFLIIHDEKTTYHGLATIFVKQCYETLIDVAQENGGKLPHRTNFILDEFANMPALKDVTTMVTAARSRQIRFTFIIQNFAQLNEVYGEHDAETIRSNCQNLIYLLTTELSALEEISKLCGEVKSKDDEKTASTPLVTVSDLQKLEMNEVIILRNRLNPFRTKLKQAYTIDWGDREFGKAVFTSREKKEIQLFDIKEFVKVRKRSKMGDMGSGLGGGGALSGLGVGGRGSGIGGSLGDSFGGGFAGLDSRSPFGGGESAPKIPTYEEWMASRKNNESKPSSSPFGGFDTKPFGGEEPKPFGSEPKFDSFDRKPMGGITDPTKNTNFSQPKERPSFDLDELVKRIDAKIEELEAEEKRKSAESHASKPTITLPDSVLKSDKDKLNVKPVDEDIVKIADNGNYQQEKPVSIPPIDDDLDDDLDDIIDAPTIDNKVVMEAPKEPSNGMKQFEEKAIIDNNLVEEDITQMKPEEDFGSFSNTNEMVLEFEDKKEEPKEEDKFENIDKGLDELHIEPMKNLTFDSDDEFEERPMNKPSIMISNPIEMASVPNSSVSSTSTQDRKPLRGIVDPTIAYTNSNNDKKDYKENVSRSLSDVSDVVGLDRDIKGDYIKPVDEDNKKNSLETRIRKPIPGSVVVGNDINGGKQSNYSDDFFDN